MSVGNPVDGFEFHDQIVADHDIGAVCAEDRVSLVNGRDENLTFERYAGLSEFDTKDVLVGGFQGPYMRCTSIARPMTRLLYWSWNMVGCLSVARAAYSAGVNIRLTRQVNLRDRCGLFFRQVPHEGHEDSTPRRIAKDDFGGDAAITKCAAVQPADIGDADAQAPMPSLRESSCPSWGNCSGGATQKNPSQVAPPKCQPRFFSIASVNRCGSTLISMPARSV